MATEIEKKFLVRNDDWKTGNPVGIDMCQGYLAGSAKSSVRVRIEGDSANLNIKSATLGVRRLEYEYAIPVTEAREMLEKLAEGPLIQKTRYHVHVHDHLWDVDVFHGDNQGLVVAEIELQDEQEKFVLPSWAGAEVSGDTRYYNVSLSKTPYKHWKQET